MNERDAILKALTDAPSEAFSWYVVALKETVEKNEWNHGFTRESTRNFIDMAKAINGYAQCELIDMTVVRSHNPTFFEEPKP